MERGSLRKLECADSREADFESAQDGSFGAYSSFFGGLLSADEDPSMNKILQTLLADFHDLCFKAFEDASNSRARIIIDAIVLILASTISEDVSPGVVGFKSYSIEGVEMSSINDQLLIRSIFEQWKCLAKVSDPKCSEARTWLLMVKDLCSRISSGRLRVVAVRPLLKASHRGHDDTWRTSVLSYTTQELSGRLGKEASQPFEHDLRGLKRSVHTLTSDLDFSSTKWAVVCGLFGLCLGGFGIGVTIASSMSAGLLVIPVLAVLALGVSARIWYNAVKGEGFHRIDRESQNFDSFYVSLVSMTLVSLGSGYQSPRNLSRTQRHLSSNNCFSVLLEKSSSVVEGDAKEIKEIDWPALQVNEENMIEASDIVTIKLDPSGTMVLPLDIYTKSQCPILLDGFHVHQHIALFGVSLDGASLDSSPSGSSGEDGQFMTPPDMLPRLDDADDRRFTVSMWNDAISRITGFSSSAVMFNPFADFIADERSYATLKKLILHFEECSVKGEPLPDAPPFQISILTSACDRVTLSVTAAPVSESVATEDASPLGEGHLTQKLVGVLFLGSLATSDDLYHWKNAYYATLLRYFHAKARPVHTLEQIAIGSCLSSDVTAEDFKSGTVSLLEGAADGSVAFSPLQIALMKMATDHFSASTEAEGAPFVFCKGPHDRSGLVFKRQGLVVSLLVLLSGRHISMPLSRVRARSSLPRVMEVDLDGLAEILALLIKDGSTLDSMTLGPFGKGHRGEGTIAMAVRLEGVSMDTMSYVSNRLAPNSDSDATPGPLWECMEGAGGFIFTSDKGLVLSADSQQTSSSGENALVVVVPCRAWSEARSLDEPMLDIYAGAAKATAEGALRSIDSSNPRLPPLSILVSNCTHITRSNLMRLLSDDHHAVFPIKGDLLPSGAHFMRTCGRIFDVIVADAVDEAHVSELHELCREFSSTSFVLKKRGRKIATQPSDPIVSTTESECLLSIIQDDEIKALTAPANLHFVDGSHTPISQRQLVKFIESVALAAAESQKKALDVKEILKGHVNSPWQKGQRLGKGSFGDVYEAHMTLTGGVTAVKTIRVRQTDDGSDPLSAIVAEIGILVRLQHPNIVQYFYCEQETDAPGMLLHIFMELCRGGSLKDKIAAAEAKLPKTNSPPQLLDGHDTFGGPLTLTEIASNLLQIVDALAYLHSQHIVHRDIKPGNLLLSAGKIKMADFGTATMVGKGKSLQDTAGTFAYMAPEVYSGDNYGYPCDVWSVGCVLLDMLGSHLRKSITAGMEGSTIFSGYFGDSPNDGLIRERLQKYIIHPELRSFLLRCLCVSPGDRASAVELRHHPFLTRHTLRQDAIVRNSSLIRSASEWKKLAKQVKDSLDALSIASDDSEWEDASAVLNFSSDKSGSPSIVTLRATPKQAGAADVVPFTPAALEVAESAAFECQTPCNVWCGTATAASKKVGIRISAPSPEGDNQTTTRGWNPLWGRTPLQSPSRVRTQGFSDATPATSPHTVKGSQKTPNDDVANYLRRQILNK